MVWKELKIKNVAAHRRTKGLLLAASVNPLTKVDKLFFMLLNVIETKVSSFNDDFPLIKSAGTKAMSVQNTLT